MDTLTGTIKVTLHSPGEWTVKGNREEYTGLYSVYFEDVHDQPGRLTIESHDIESIVITRAILPRSPTEEDPIEGSTPAQSSPTPVAEPFYLTDESEEIPDYVPADPPSHGSDNLVGGGESHGPGVFAKDNTSVSPISSTSTPGTGFSHT